MRLGVSERQVRKILAMFNVATAIVILELLVSVMFLLKSVDSYLHVIGGADGPTAFLLTTYDNLMLDKKP